MTRDATISATFRNPANGDKLWSYGFEFRKTDKVFSRLIFSSLGIWRKRFLAKDANDNYVRDTRKEESGSIEPLSVNANDTNDVQLVLTNRVGELFVNKTRVASISFGENLEAGDITVGSGFFSDDVTGLTVPYSNFLWPPRHPPLPRKRSRPRWRSMGRRAAPPPNPAAGIIPSINALVPVTNAIVSARFINPYAATRKAFDYGFSFRLSTTKLYRLILYSDKTWKLSYVTKAATDTSFPVNGATEVDKGTWRPHCGSMTKTATMWCCNSWDRLAPYA